jgi:hypothetical protein
VWLPCSLELTPLDFFLGSYVKDKVYSQRFNSLDELKAQITAPIANVENDMLQRIWQETEFA